jgi:hypothetical protein
MSNTTLRRKLNITIMINKLGKKKTILKRKLYILLKILE